ncbi:hypothetical protein NFJ02_02g70390 [Pycnococcus provasolii]
MPRTRSRSDFHPRVGAGVGAGGSAVSYRRTLAGYQDLGDDAVSSTTAASSDDGSLPLADDVNVGDSDVPATRSGVQARVQDAFRAARSAEGARAGAAARASDLPTLDEERTPDESDEEGIFPAAFTRQEAENHNHLNTQAANDKAEQQPTQTQMNSAAKDTFKAAAGAALDVARKQNVSQFLTRVSNARFGKQAKAKASLWNGGREPLARTAVISTRTGDTDTSFLTRNYTQNPHCDVEADEGTEANEFGIGSYVPTAFTQEIPRELICPICKDAAIDPVIDEVYGQGRTTCRNCLVVREGDAYVARCKPDERASERLLNQIPILCRYAWQTSVPEDQKDSSAPLITTDASGCRARTFIGSRRDHEATCQFRRVRCNLPYSSNPAENCSQVLRLSQIHSHRTTCEHNVAPCPNEGCGRMIQRRRREAHERLCDYKRIRCSQSTRSNPCPWEGCQKDLEEHIRTDCLRVLVTCNNKDVQGPDPLGHGSVYLNHRKEALQRIGVEHMEDKDAGSMVNIDALYSIEPPSSVRRHCAVSKLRSEVDEHRRTECPFRLVKCSFCSAQLSFKNLYHHERLCNSRYYRCSACMRPVHRHRKEKHIQANCPAHEVECMFVGLGCGVRVQRSEFEAHMLEGVGWHLQLLCTAPDDGIDDFTGRILAMHSTLIRVRESSQNATMDLAASCKLWWQEVEEWREGKVLRTIQDMRAEIVDMKQTQRESVEALRIEAEAVSDYSDEKLLRLYASAKRMKDFAKEQHAFDEFARGNYIEKSSEELREHARALKGQYQSLLAFAKHNIDANVNALVTVAQRRNKWADEFARMLKGTSNALAEVKARRIATMTATHERIRVADSFLTVSSMHQNAIHDRLGIHLSSLLPDGGIANFRSSDRQRQHEQKGDPSNGDDGDSPTLSGMHAVLKLDSDALGHKGAAAQRHLVFHRIQELDEIDEQLNGSIPKLERKEKELSKARNDLLDAYADTGAREVQVEYYDTELSRTREQLMKARVNLQQSAQLREHLSLALQQVDASDDAIRHREARVQQESEIGVIDEENGALTMSEHHAAELAKSSAIKRSDIAKQRLDDLTSKLSVALERGKSLFAELQRIRPRIAARARLITSLAGLRSYNGVSNVVEDMHVAVARARSALDFLGEPSEVRRPRSPSASLASLAEKTFSEIYHECTGYQSEASALYLRSRDSLVTAVQRIDGLCVAVRSAHKASLETRASLVDSHNRCVLEFARLKAQEAQDINDSTNRDAKAIADEHEKAKTVSHSATEAYKNSEIDLLHAKRKLEVDIAQLIDGAIHHLEDCEYEVAAKESELQDIRIKDHETHNLVRTMMATSGKLNLNAPANSGGLHAPHMHEYRSLLADLRKARNGIMDAKENLRKANTRRDEQRKAVRKAEALREDLKVKQEKSELDLQIFPERLQRAAARVKKADDELTSARAALQRVEDALSNGDADLRESVGLMSNASEDDNSGDLALLTSAEDFVQGSEVPAITSDEDTTTDSEALLDAMSTCLDDDKVDVERQRIVIRAVDAFDAISQDLRRWRDLRRVLYEAAREYEDRQFALDEANLTEDGGTEASESSSDREEDDEEETSSDNASESSSTSAQAMDDENFGTNEEAPDSSILSARRAEAEQLIESLIENSSRYTSCLDALFGSDTSETDAGEPIDLSFFTGMRVTSVVSHDNDDETSNEESTVEELMRKIHWYGGDEALSRLAEERARDDNNSYMHNYSARNLEVQQSSLRLRTAQARVRACRKIIEESTEADSEQAFLHSRALQSAEELLQREMVQQRAALKASRDARHRLESACARFLATEFENANSLSTLLHRLEGEARDAEGGVTAAADLVDAIALQLDACERSIQEAREAGGNDVDISTMHEHSYQLDKRLYAAKRALDAAKEHATSIDQRVQIAKEKFEMVDSSEKSKTVLATKAWEAAALDESGSGVVEAELRLRVEGARCTSDRQVLQIVESLSAAAWRATSGSCGIDVLHVRDEARRAAIDVLLRLRIIDSGNLQEPSESVWMASFREFMTAGNHVTIVVIDQDISKTTFVSNVVHWPADEWAIVREVTNATSKLRREILASVSDGDQLPRQLGMSFVQEASERSDVLGAQHREACSIVESATFDYQKARFDAARRQWEEEQQMPQEGDVGQLERESLEKAQIRCDRLANRAQEARVALERAVRFVGSIHK